MAFAKYTLMRVLVFAVVAGLLYVVGVRAAYILIPLAIFLSGLFSIFVLNHTRDEASASLSNRLSTIKGRLEDATRAEDDWDENQRHQP
jgi:hypothetical protein